ncbi:HPF/RaiA family ribosome-associated protein [Oxalobacter aliiformigenes]|uniref:HPF/RaiA family ribosome-associated protein n=1 Tax=Oxalobacter aliiformigenes TaxID=2946593 RepID=A0ABY7JIP4_9BURK|nr:HPF/RaiA family ribosome-associated protein [Oxalobacter aliiformigenes]WAV93786.1 HPF/RaiA family ribosome-associated protein [Oxalobacter aliiformigenes]WAV94711.1 HPF/RaiA family ribosome-associated protein [Oxalobacter aliiformigenes]WAV97480.1 HPF/RaiA family ribosome-associated protein [Oxalobacter aliiformigenes]
MEPTIITKGIKAGEALQDYITERLNVMLSHAQDSINLITVRLSDTNRIKSGFKKRCLIRLVLPGMSPIVVTEFAADVKSAVDSATRRATRLLNKTMSKAKSIPHDTLPLYFNKPFLAI